VKFFLLLSIFSFIPGLSPADSWNAEAASAKINFTLDGPFGKVHGSFSGLKSTLEFGENNLGGSSLTASIDPNSVKTGVGLRNTDLRNEAEWLDTKKYPTISFKSQKIEKTSAGYEVSGDLNLKGITKPVKIPFTFSSSGATGLFKGSFSIKREDYQVGKPGGSVGSEIDITIEVPVKK
jgi:polyisoprenoid-binding protein YceI